ncbi:MAG: sulfotransferase [Cyanobacteria bacterium P01_G01_bin.19]
MLFLLKKILKTERIAIDVMFIYLYKKINHSYLFNLFQKKESKILFIIGCQRSGTSLMNRIFTREPNTSVYRESSQLSSRDPGKLRLNPFEEVKSALAKNYAPLIVIKPIVESQNALQLLENFPESKILWMYRNYKDAIKSYSKRFSGNRAIIDLKPIVELDRQSWRAEKASDYVHSMIIKYYSEDMSQYDAIALFWFARNQLFYELNLDQNSKVLMCKYEDLVAHPTAMMKTIYQFLDINFQEIRGINEVHSQSVGRGDAIELSPSIDKLCYDLQEKLDRTYSLRSYIESGSALNKCG